MKRIIEMKEISKTYSNRFVKNNVLKNINLTVDKGDFIGIFGPSGCGKSTLLNLIGLLDNATEGTYLYNGKKVEELSNNKKAHIRLSTMGSVFQAFHLIEYLEVKDNVELPLGYLGKTKTERNQRSLELLERVGLKNKAKASPNTLSGGEKQRVAIARALANNPDILLADEPTGALDQVNAKEIMRLLKELNDNGTTILMVTHDLSYVDYMSKTIFINDGRIEHNKII